MEIRLNRLISESGICSRREADKLIESGRVSVNGKKPRIGEKVTETDLVEVDGERLHISKHLLQEMKEAESLKEQQQSIFPDKKPKATVPREKYGKYNKYAAARKAAKAAAKDPKSAEKEQLRREASAPKFGRSLSRSAIAQRMAFSPKSAALRKTSRNNPINKARRAFGKNN